MSVAMTAATRFNVEASLNKAFTDAISAITRPAWLTALPAFVYNWDEVAALMPCFAFFHIPAGMLNTHEGRNVGDGQSGRKALGILEVDCYVTRTNTANWSAILRTMRDMVETAAVSLRTVTVYDYQTTPASPTATQYKVNIDDVQETPVEPDAANPAIQRARILITYSFTYRAS